MSLNKAILEAATFEWLPSELIADIVFKFPEGKPLSLSHQECGLE